MAEETQEEIERYNTASLWNEVQGRLEVAMHELGLVEGLLEDLGKPHLAANLKPTIEAVGRFRKLATDNAFDDADGGEG